MQGTAEIHVEPRLTSDTAWFLLCTKRPIKPLIFQQRKKAKFVSKTAETDDNVFFSKKFLYGVDSRDNAGFGFWQMKIKQYMIVVYAVLVKNGKRELEELPEEYIIPVAEYLAKQEEDTPSGE